MAFLSRMMGLEADPREALRPLWHRVVELARAPHWYAREGVADTLAGRFDMVTAVLALVLLRMERDPALAAPAALLTELFVEDMDGQLRESGVGDLKVGKHVGKLVGVLGGRLGALREGFAADGDAVLVAALGRNITFLAGADRALLAAALRNLHEALGAVSDADLLDGRIPS